MSCVPSGLEGPAPTNQPDLPTTVIAPAGLWRSLPVREMWAYRDLLWFLTLRDIRIRYKQTLLGASWAVLQPLVTMIVLNLFFGRMLGVSAHVDADVPYPVFLYAGLLPWTLFTSSMTASSNSLVANGHILKKIYFPRLLLPVSSLGAPLVDFAIAFAVLFGMMAWFGVAFSVKLLLVPLLLANLLVVVAGLGLVLASLSVSYRDIRYAVPFILQTWFFLTPVIYPVTIVPDRAQWVLNLNPMAGVIDMFRAVILSQPIDLPTWGLSFVTGLLLLTVGLIYFQRVERRFADVV